MKKSGFSLAEVLIALAIIGVVAAISIPSLMNTTNDKELKAQFKKMHASLSSITQELVFENGGTLEYAFDDNYMTFGNAFYNKFQNASNRKGYGDGKGICNHLDGVMHQLKGDQDNGFNNIQCFTTNTGAYVVPYFFNDTCTGNWWGMSSCGFIGVDVNGAKGPNVYGRDYFFWFILKDRLVPFGTEDSTTKASTTCNSGGNGWGCATYVLQGVDY